MAKIPEKEHEQTTIILGQDSENIDDIRENLPAVLICLMGPQGCVGRRWTLGEERTVIGRSAKSQICIDDPSVSRIHASVTPLSDSDIVLTDLGSRNGTRLDNDAIPPAKAVALRDNQQIKVGTAVFKYLAPGNIESLSNKYLYESAQKDATTGAYSRGGLDQLGPDAVRKAGTQQSPLSVILLDIDHFKRINDDFGHLSGDTVLQELVRLIQKELLRTGDYLARFGGEEFVVILTETTFTQAIDIAERIRQRIERQRFELEHSRIPVTVSLGVSELRGAAENWEDLLKRADDALYASKRGGRNRVSGA